MLKGFFGLQTENKLAIGGARYWMPQERTRAQAARASGLRRAFSALKVFAREYPSLGGTALCARSGSLYAKSTVIVGRWDTADTQIMWNLMAVS